MVGKLLFQLELSFKFLFARGLLVLLCDLRQLEFFAFEERRVTEALLVARVTCFDKIVHVQLAHE